MKRILFSLSLLLCIRFVSAQETKENSDSVKVSPGVGVELALNMCFGGGSNNSGNVEQSNFAYASVVNRGVRNDTIQYKPSGGVGIGLDLSLLFVKKRNLGMSAGLIYVTGVNTFNLNSFHVEYEARDAEGRSFRRILSASTWQEKVTYHNLSIPILFKFRHNWKKRFGFYADLGPVISVLSTAKSKISAKLDFEAVYSLSEGVPHFSEQSESSDWLLTREMAVKHLTPGGPYLSISDYFIQQYQQGYYIALDQAKSGTAPTVRYKVGFGGLLRAGFRCRINPVFTISLGGQCLIVSSGRKGTSTYKPVNVGDNLEGEGELISIQNSTGSLLKAQYGVNIGLHVNLAK
jgi:hypothetical protein